jgi:Xaa-Pro dipeptidase
MIPFPKSEFDARIAKVKRAMEKAGVDVLLSTDTANMNYLTGYDGWSFYTPQMVIVALDAAEPIWTGRLMDAKGTEFTTYLKPENVRGFPDIYVQTPERHAASYMAEILKEKGWANKRIGLEMDSFYFTPRAYEELRRSLPGATWVNADLLVNWVRIVKSPAEVRHMQEAGKIVERVMQTAYDEIVPGARECDVVAEVYRAMTRGTPKFGGDYSAFVPLVMSGRKSAAPHLTWTDEKIKNNSAVTLELSAARFHYHSVLCRTVYLGTPPADLVRLADVCNEAISETLIKVKPDMRCEEVHATWNAVISKAGYSKESRVGYSLGVNYPPDWGEHTASLRPGDKTVLVPNMTFHMVTGMWGKDFGYEVSESWRVTETGCETLAKFPKDLHVKGARGAKIASKAPKSKKTPKPRRAARKAAKKKARRR